MKKWNHLNFEQRKIIRSSLVKSMKLRDIADLLDVDPTTISKEIKRNRDILKKSSVLRAHEICEMTKRFPHCCDGCPKRRQCPLTQFTYIPEKAQSQADFRLIATRQGLNTTEEAFGCLDAVIKKGVDDKQSIYHIVKDNPHLDVSVSTVYRWINEGLLKTKRLDLPYSVKYKKRKVKKQYEYKENVAVNRTHRTYLDFIRFQRENPSYLHVQMDYLGKIVSDKKKHSCNDDSLSSLCHALSY